MRKLQLAIKRIFDFCVALVMILVLTVIPVFIIIPIAIKLTSKGPVVFTQERVGKDGKIFKIYKFRTMLIPSESFDKDGNPLGNYERITKVGAFLRKTSLDELMQLFNVLNGTMSIIGPRPTLLYQVEKYTDEQRRRLEMRPGVTGWAQVNGRNELSWTEKIKYDIEYIDNFSLWMDIKILFKTVGVVFKKEGIAFTKADAISSETPTQTTEEKAQKKALVLCGGIPQIALIEDLKSRGITTVLADMNENVGARKYADIFYPVSTLDVNGIKEVAQKENVDFVITVCADQVLQVVAQVSEELNLPCYIDFETAENVSKKSYMKKIFKDYGVPTSQYVIMETLEEDKLSGLSYPLIVKPVDSYSSRGVRRVENLEELQTAFADAVQISRTKTAIVEEFVVGNELTVDVYVEEGKAHVLGISNLDKIGDADRFVIYRTRFPADITDEIQAKVQETAQKIAEAFGLKNTPMLIQLIENGKDISVVEFCARTGGGDKFRLIEKVSGFNVIKAVVDLTLGEKPHVEERTEKPKYIVNEFLYCKPGVFERLEGFDELLAKGVITEYYQLKSKGVEFGEIKSSGDRVAYFTIETDTIEEMKEKHALANATIKVIDAEGNDILRHDLLEKYA
ncbi:MAG: sugar transferase [Clostridia bacterium]|nr:sugar transferase [Clostridia bacterium]